MKKNLSRVRTSRTRSIVLLDLEKGENKKWGYQMTGKKKNTEDDEETIQVFYNVG